MMGSTPKQPYIPEMAIQRILIWRQGVSQEPPPEHERDLETILDYDAWRSRIFASKETIRSPSDCHTLSNSPPPPPIPPKNPRRLLTTNHGSQEPNAPP